MRFLVALALASVSSGFDAWKDTNNLAAKHRAARLGQSDSLPKTVSARDTSTYLNQASKKFVVNGTQVPEVPFDVGESYAGLLPISDSHNETRQLYFWFFPAQEQAQAKDEIVIWLSGGPGCSSLAALLQENGPFLWQSGTKSPVKNPYSWSRLTNMVWIDQPVGTGYSQGTPNITNEAELAEQFKGFWKNFVETFDVQGRKVYITGESYAGRYVPYIANAFLEANDTNNFNLKGIAINNPVIGNSMLQAELVSLSFGRFWSSILSLSSASLDQLQKKADSCGYTKYLNKYFTFPPPKAPFVDPPEYCGMTDQIMGTAFDANPCFNIFHVSDQCPHIYGPIGIINPGDYSPTGAEIYFNRTDVKKAINAPLDSNWQQCSGLGFAKPDSSIGPALDGTLTKVIDSTKNVLVGSGDLDFLLISNGTLFALQNTTWGGTNGFQSRPDTPFVVPKDTNTFKGATGGHGNLGVWREERGLTFYTVQLAGHELPGYSLTGGYRVLQRLIGRIKDFNSTDPLF